MFFNKIFSNSTKGSEDVTCRTCSALGDVSNLMMCIVCGDHYHGTCVGLAQQPGVRAGWQCKTCRLCQICRIPDNTEGRSLACENCDKLYHAQCLRPVMATIPKYGWKCRCCRICSDCGARTPGWFKIEISQLFYFINDVKFLPRSWSIISMAQPLHSV